MWSRPCPPPPVCPQYLPISTGNVGLSLGTGAVEMYGHNYRGTGIGLFYGCANWCPPCPPWWGAGPGCCGYGSYGNGLAAVLTGANWCKLTVPPCPYPPTISPVPPPGSPPCPPWSTWPPAAAPAH